MTNSFAQAAPVPVEADRRWLVLSYHVPRSPAAQYMSIYRHLRGLHVVNVRAGLAALPDDPDAESTLQRAAARINALKGGSAVLLRSDVVNDVDHLVAAYNTERNSEYDDLISLCQRLAGVGSARGTREELAVRRRLVRVSRKLDDVMGRDLFEASHRALAVQALSEFAADRTFGAEAR